jgi:TPR repeat protein
MYRLDRLCRGALAKFARPSTKLALATQLAAQGAHRDAFPLFVKAAKAGLSTASYELGRIYLFGHGVPRCVAEALRWLNQAAAAGEVGAQSLLAGLAFQGVYQTTPTGLFDGILNNAERTPNYDLALKWARRALEGGSSDAKILLGFLLTAGPAQMRDQEQGEALYRQAAEAGNALGQLAWALVLLRRNPVEAATEARRLLEAAASAGLPMAHYMLGTFAEKAEDLPAAAERYRTGAELGYHAAELRYGMALLTGRGVRQDTVNGESWLRRAGLAGESRAAAMVGALYASAGPLPPNYIEAAIWFRRAAEAGHPGAARVLGQLHLRGAGVVRDPQEAALWLRNAATQGDDIAMADLAHLALTRQASEADGQAAFAWFQQKAEAGNPAAIFNLGICLAEGIGTPRDDTQALTLFRQAAKCMPVAEYWCGRMLAEGRGSALDLPAARACFLQAAEQHNADAEAAAGEMLLNGRGGPPDRNKAMVLLMRAAAAGHRGASLALDVLRRSEPRASAVNLSFAA